MSNTDTVKGHVAVLRQRTVHNLEELSDRTKQFELSKLPGELDTFRQRLAANTYNVLVVGEAKRGKSSFVNALIGRDLLPTDVAIATNQVFRVSQSPKDAYRLRFEDDSSQEITAAELLDYGSQVIADRENISRINLEQLRWIEVDVPVRFLPPGVSFLDTPGLGSLYAAHAQITQHFIPHADAVVFVLDSSQPMGQFELDFVESILSATPHIFFIQTKIDLYDKEDWQKILQRNEAILQDRFKDRLIEPCIWPISSRNLMKAAETGNSAFLKVSRQKELLDALEMFLFKVAGWNRCADALLIADHFYTTSRKLLAGRLAGLEDKSTDELSSEQLGAADRKEQFEAEWGTHGKKRKDLLSKAQKIANVQRKSFMSFLETGGELEVVQRKKINTIQSLEEADKLGMMISEEVVTQTVTKWRSVCEETHLQYTVLLGSFIEATRSLLPSSEDPDLLMHIGTPVNLQDDLWGRFNEAGVDLVEGINVGLGVAIVVMLFIPVAPVLALVGIALAGIWGGVRGWSSAEEAQLKDAQERLHEHLDCVIQEVRKRFLQPDSRYKGQSLVNHYFDSLMNLINDQIEDIVQEKFEEAWQESIRINEQIKMDRQQRATRTEELRQQLSEWDNLGRSIRTTAVDLKALEQSFTDVASN